jgi:hypothetical protein
MSYENRKVYYKLYHIKNKTRINAYNKQWCANNKEYLETYKKDNKERIAAYQKEHKADRARNSAKHQKTEKGKATHRKSVGKFMKTEKGKSVTARYRKSKYDFIHQIKAKYGCCNPSCQWKGILQPCQLDFHHIDPTSKLFNVGIAAVGKNKKLIITEVNKCTLLCANCHREVTWNKLDTTYFKQCNETLSEDDI